MPSPISFSRPARFLATIAATSLRSFWRLRLLCSSVFLVCATMLGTASAYTALAFFSVSSSLAEAIAAADAGLPDVAAGAAGVCAMAGAPINANATARPAAGKLRNKLFISVLLLEIAALAPLHYANSLRAGQDGRVGKANKQTVFDNAGNQAEQARQARCITDAPEMGIDNPVAAIGDKNVAIFGLAEPHLPGNTALRKCPCHRPLRRGQPERNHLHRQ